MFKCILLSNFQCGKGEVEEGGNQGCKDKIEGGIKLYTTPGEHSQRKHSLGIAPITRCLSLGVLRPLGFRYLFSFDH